MLRPLFRPASNGQGILGTNLVGVLAADLPSGFALPGLLNNDVSGTDPAGCLYRVEIINQPSAGVLEVAENGAFSFTGAPDGTYTGATKVYKNDVPDTGSYSFQIGSVVTPPDPVQPAPRFARLMSDITKGEWQPSTGNDLYAVLNEITPDESTYISTTGSAPFEMAFGPVADPFTSANQVVYVRAKSGPGGKLTINFKQGSAIVASRTFADLPPGYVTLQIRLTSAECDSITNYSDLRLEGAPN